MINVELDPQAINKYLRILIAHEDKRSVELIMDRFQKGLMLGDDVTKLLSSNAKFSLQLLSNAPQTHAYTIQISESAQKYPLETGNVAVGMYVLTPAGWGRIDVIEGPGSTKLQLVSKDQKLVKFHVTLYPDTEHALRAILDMENEKLQVQNAEKYIQCGNCGFLSTDQRYIRGQHSREAHSGILAIH